MTVIPKNLYCFWTGNNCMGDGRAEAFLSLKNSSLSIILVTPENLATYIDARYPLHPAYEYLSFVHRADYLRVYFMHVYGGGYADIKKLNSSWLPSHMELEKSNALGIGYVEISRRFVAAKGTLDYLRCWYFYRRLLGNCAYIFKPQTELTTCWFSKTTQLLDQKLPALRASPACHAEDFNGRVLPEGRSSYPLRWTELLGEIFHPLCLKYADRLLYSLPSPIFDRSEDR